MKLTENAPAKINLLLKILNKTEDNYHYIFTLFHSIDLCDTIDFSLDNKTKLITLNNTDGLPEENKNNIVVKTLDFLNNKYNTNINGQIQLYKYIPIGAGLGGGSADAGAIIRIYERITDINVNCYDEIATELGADIPFCIKNGLAFGADKGDKLNYINYDLDLYFLIIKPDIEILSGNAYKWFDDSDYSKNNQLISERGLKEKIIDFIFSNRYKKNIIDKNFIQNDFQPVIFEKYNLYSQIQNNLIDYNNYVLTGSGAGIVVIFNNRDERDILYQKLSKKNLMLYKAKSY